MDTLCEVPPSPLAEVVIVDMHSKKREIKPIESISESSRSIRQIVKCNDGYKSIMVPVAEIRIYSINNAGESVPTEQAISLYVKYLDKNGNVLESARMDAPRK